jgi:succinate dehydrogenase/fumarate reductase cytochrome b subunit
MTTNIHPHAVRERARWLRRLHRASAFVLAAYALPHLVNHLLALGGIERHIAFMHAVRQVVRLPGVEALLLASVACQAVSGLALLVRRRQLPGGLAARAQAWSGAGLAFFLCVHVGAVLNARLALGLDTNFHFAAAGLQTVPFTLFFIPYYTMALIALAVHVACALRRFLPRTPQRINGKCIRHMDYVFFRLELINKPSQR